MPLQHPIGCEADMPFDLITQQFFRFDSDTHRVQFRQKRYRTLDSLAKGYFPRNVFLFILQHNEFVYVCCMYEILFGIKTEQ